MAVTDLCRQRVIALLTGPELPLSIELELARQVRTGETTITQPGTGFATIQDRRDCLAFLERQAAAAGVEVGTVGPAGVPVASEPRLPVSALAELQTDLADAAADPRASSLTSMEPVPPGPQLAPEGAIMPLTLGGTSLLSRSFLPTSQQIPTMQTPTGGSGSFLGDLGQSLLGLGTRFLERQLLPPPPTSSIAAVQCPEGFEFDPDTQTCRVGGFGGFVQRTLPGGQTGVMESGAAVQGLMGIPALNPMVVGQVTRNDGRVSPILRCGPGLVLGKDNLCYAKAAIPRRWRKWPRAPRPPVTAGDAKAIRKAAAATKRVKKLAGNVGFTCVKKGTRRPR